MTLVVALNLLVTGGWQWRHGRYEASVDRFYDRVHLTNNLRRQYLVEAVHEVDGRWAVLQTLLSPRPVEARPKSDEALMMLLGQYVFTELDNLEYALKKYQLGFMDKVLMERALNTFLNRCLHVDGVAEKVKNVYRNAAYDKRLCASSVRS